MMGVFDYKLVMYLFHYSIYVNKIIQSLMTKYLKLWLIFTEGIFQQQCVFKEQNMHAVYAPLRHASMQ